MPPTAPKSLSPTEYVAVMALLLRNTAVPSGATPLPTDRQKFGVDGVGLHALHHARIGDAGRCVRANGYRLRLIPGE